MHSTREATTRFVDCNEFTWQVQLWLDREPVYYSARAAAVFLGHETSLWQGGRGDQEKATKLRRQRQTGKL